MSHMGLRPFCSMLLTTGLFKICLSSLFIAVCSNFINSKNTLLLSSKKKIKGELVLENILVEDIKGREQLMLGTGNLSVSGKEVEDINYGAG